jgi:acetolactate synthase I/II/III large subunit
VRAALTPNPTPLGNISTLIIPADCAWGDAHYQPAARIDVTRPGVAADAVAGAAAVLTAKSILLVDGPGLFEEGVQIAARIAAATGCKVFAPTFPARLEAGPSLPGVMRMPYFPEQIMHLLQDVDQLVLAGADAPVSFFAYRNLPSNPVPESCRPVRLVHRHEDVVDALAQLAERVKAPAAAEAVGVVRPDVPAGEIKTMAVAQLLGALLPENCIVCSDSGGGGAAAPVLARALRHTWLSLTGGAIGQGGPAATGAALACPDRQVLALLGDGGAMYTIQCLWTQAREKLNVINVIFSNRSYQILEIEYRRLGINEIGDRARSMFDLSNPNIDWVGLGASMGVAGRRARDCETFAAALREGLENDGPYMIEVDLAG